MQKVPVDYLACRDLRHQWMVEDDFHVTSQAKDRNVYVARSVVCERCGTVRVERYQLTRDGLELTSRYYNYVEGYQLANMPRGLKPVSLVREEIYRRAQEKASARGRRKAA